MHDEIIYYILHFAYKAKDYCSRMHMTNIFFMNKSYDSQAFSPILGTDKLPANSRKGFPPNLPE